MTTTASHPTTTATEDRLAILELTARLALLVDARDWSALEGLFTNPVYSDRTSLFGGEPQTGSPGELVGGLRQALGNLDATHHLIACQVISLDGDQATSAANMQGTHVFANASGGPVRTVVGRHDYELKRTADGWRIAGLTFTLQWASGNEHILTLAAAAR
jgi:SnoaL-like domain